MMLRGAVAGLGFTLVACGQAEPPTIVTPDAPAPGTITETTRNTNAAITQRLDFSDTSDVEDAARGLLGRIEQDAILNEAGGVVWPIAQFGFLNAEAPDSVNPSLWRQSQLAAEHGLFEVADGLYQIRGYDLAVMSVIRGETGWILVDPLTATETAAAGLALVNATLGERPVTGVLYTHSHVDHFGGARGVLTDEEIALGSVPILAPIGFTESAVAENLLAGNTMSRRATLMFGNTIPRNVTAHVGSGLGPGLPNGTISFVPPTEEISGRGTLRVIDGVTFEFIDAAGTEAPAEFMFYLPEFRALCTAEVATATFHNVLTPRGAKVRDALAWSKAIDHVLVEYGDRSDVVFASHHWPTWGQDRIKTYLTGQRDIYRYVHDQTLRKANAGATMVEAAEALSEPDLQGDRFDTRGYYGTLNHNSKAVYQHYFGWWGGIPAEYNRLPHEESAARYVEAMGGSEAVLSRGQQAFESGDYRWAAELFNHVVFADPENKKAKDWLAAAYEQLGFQAESGAWRSYYLAGASELRNGVPTIGNPALGNADFLKQIPSIELFDAMAVRFNPDKLTRDPFLMQFNFTDTGEVVSLDVGTSVVVPREGAASDPVATVTLERTDFDRLILQQANFGELMAGGDIQIEGDGLAAGAFLLALDQPPFWFNIVTP